MPRLDVPAGTRFGRLVVVEELGLHRYPSGRSRRQFLCECDCGNTCSVVISNLRSGNTQSCGCVQKEVAANTGKAVLATHGLSMSPTYVSWDHMRQRCSNANRPNYAEYGGRGISVCERWQESFEAFLADMGERPEGMTLDRIDTDGDYEPSNCRWATLTQQSRNKRNNVTLTHRGVTRCVGEWAQRIGISSGTIHQRIRRGWTAEEALTTPAGGR